MNSEDDGVMDVNDFLHREGRRGRQDSSAKVNEEEEDFEDGTRDEDNCEDEGDNFEGDSNEAVKVWDKLGTRPDGYENKLKRSQLVGTLRFATTFWTQSKPPTRSSFP